MYDIMQWNIQGRRAKYEELMELKESRPAVMCIQEIMLGTYVPFLKGYSAWAHSQTPDLIPGTGILALVKEDIPCHELPLVTEFQACAVRVRLRREITLRNIYVNHQQRFTQTNLRAFFNQLPTPFIVFGDFQGKCSLWGGDEINNRGRALEEFITQYVAVLLNTGDPTHLDARTANASCIDLSIASPALATDVAWKVHDCLRGSDYFPITVADTLNGAVQACPMYVIEKVDWKLFTVLTYTRDNADGRYINELLTVFNNAITFAAQQSIPQTKGTFARRPVPWWNEQCAVANVERKSALWRYQRSKLVLSKIAYNRARAKTRFVKRNAKRTSWQEYISSINSNTFPAKYGNASTKLEENTRLLQFLVFCIMEK